MSARQRVAGWRLADGRVVRFAEPIEVGMTKRRPWDLRRERRAANKRARVARRINRGRS